MFGIGLPELIIVGVIAFVVFGPDRLPELAKELGRGIREFKKALADQPANGPAESSEDEMHAIQQLPGNKTHKDTPEVATPAAGNLARSRHSAQESTDPA